MATQVWTDVGQADLVDILTTDNTWRHVGWGSDATAAAVGQTALVSANPESRTAGTISQPAANTHRVVATIEATAARTVAEVGLFDAATSGNMIVRATHDSRSLLLGDRMRYTVDLLLKDSSEA